MVARRASDRNKKPVLGRTARKSSLLEIRNASARLRAETDRLIRDRQQIINEMTLGKGSGSRGRGRYLDPANRNLDAECGYKTDPTYEDFRAMYDREGFARRVVSVMPDECWAVYPEVYDDEDERTVTDFERAWQDLDHDHSVMHYLHRADVLSGIGRFGCVLLGLPGRPEDPVPGVDRDGNVDKSYKHKTRTPLSFVRVFDEGSVTITDRDLNKDPTSARVGQPEFYGFALGDPTTGRNGLAKVHWTRVVHVADNRHDSEAFGCERMRPVYNRLQDLRKLLGSSAEMFYKGGFPGLAFETLPDLSETAQIDDRSIRREVADYFNNLQRYVAVTGMTVKTLSPNVADPTGHVLQQLLGVAAGIEVPLPILLGDQAGHLASTENRIQWNRRLARRQVNYVTPWVINPTVKRLVATGVLPAPAKAKSRGRWKVAWKDLNSTTDKERAETAVRKTQALLQYVTGRVETVMPFLDFLTEVMGLSAAQARRVVKTAGDPRKFLSERAWETSKPGGNTKSQSPKMTGKSGERNSAALKA